MFKAKACGAKIAVRRQTKCVGFDGNAKKNDNRGRKEQNRRGRTRKATLSSREYRLYIH